jgi:hypothetical protein
VPDGLRSATARGETMRTTALIEAFANRFGLVQIELGSTIAIHCGDCELKRSAFTE